MNMLSALEATFAPLDTAAFVLLVVAWVGTGRLAEHPPKWRPTVSLLMQDYRFR